MEIRKSIFIKVDSWEKLELLKIINSEIFPVIYSEETYTSMMIQANYHAFLIECNDELIGAFALEIQNNNVYIFTFGILKEFRNHGIGSYLWREIELLLSNTFNPDKIELHVNVSNSKAIHFYKKHGFEIKDRVENYYEGLPSNTAYLLEKVLFKSS